MCANSSIGLTGKLSPSVLNPLWCGHTALVKVKGKGKGKFTPFSMHHAIVSHATRYLILDTRSK